MRAESVSGSVGRSQHSDMLIDIQSFATQTSIDKSSKPATAGALLKKARNYKVYAKELKVKGDYQNAVKIYKMCLETID